MQASKHHAVRFMTAVESFKVYTQVPAKCMIKSYGVLVQTAHILCLPAGHELIVLSLDVRLVWVCNPGRF